MSIPKPRVCLRALGPCECDRCKARKAGGNPELLGDVLLRSSPTLFEDVVEWGAGDAMALGEVALDHTVVEFGIGGVVKERNADGVITRFDLQEVSVIPFRPRKNLIYGDIKSMHLRAMLAGQMYEAVVGGRWSEFDGE